MSEYSHTCGDAGGVTKSGEPCGRPTRKNERCQDHDESDASSAGQYDQLGSRCLELYIGGHSYRQIEHKTGIPKSTVCDYVHRALDERRDEREKLADHYIEQEVERIRENIRHLDDALSRLVASDEYTDGGAQAVKAAKSVMAERRKQGESLRDLLGMDAPDRVDHTTKGKPVTDPLAGMSTEERKRALRRRLQLLETDERIPDDPSELEGLPGD